MLDSVLRQLSQEIGYSIHPGLSVEMQDFFRDRDDVVEYSIAATEDKCYRISARLRTHNRQEASRVFRSLVTSIEFPDATFYVRTIGDDAISYSLLSVSHDGLAFLCEVIFAQ